MIYAVSRYYNQIRKVEREEYNGTVPKYHYFDTEHLAKRFIIDRAKKDVETTYAAWSKAKAEVRMLLKKYPT